jgi:hypothetical protein
MHFDFSRVLRTSAYIVAMGSALSACGGGATGGEDPTAVPTAAGPGNPVATGTSATDTASLVDASAATQGVADAATTAAVEAAAAAAPNDAPSVVALAAVNTGGGGIVKTTTKSTRSGAGLNLGALEGTSPEIPTIDLMKRASVWMTQCGWQNTSCKDFVAGQSGWDTREEGKLDLDAQGWIKSLPAAADPTVKYRYATTTVSAGGLPDGNYIVKYDGQGTIGYSGGAAKVASQSAAGRDVVLVTAAKGGFFLSINATTPTNYLRNIRIYPPGGACASDYTTYAADASTCGGTKGAFVAFESFPSTKPWYPPFVSDVKGFRTLRFMDWMRTNTSTNADWANRALPTDRTWTGVNGAPLETMIDLANDTGTDPWVNIPAHATDDYVHQFARLAHQRLSPTLKLNLEYSNEAWNYGFAATNWMLEQAKATWPTQLAQGANPYYLELNWYAQRLAQVCTIAKQEFGADASRVTCIANTQAALASMTGQVLACTYAAPALGKPCAKFFDVVAIAPYFGYYISSPTYRPTVKTWYADADGGLTKLFEEINATDPSGVKMTAPLAAQTHFPGGARGMSSAWMVAAKTVADTYGLPMWAYEGGQHLIAPQGDTDAAFQNLIVAANRDPRMQAAYAQYLADWKAAGGQTFAYYSHVGLPSKYGMWGAKDSLSDNSAPKWKALIQARDGTTCWWAGC